MGGKPLLPGGIRDEQQDDVRSRTVHVFKDAGITPRASRYAEHLFPAYIFFIFTFR